MLLIPRQHLDRARVWLVWQWLTIAAIGFGLSQVVAVAAGVRRVLTRPKRTTQGTGGELSAMGQVEALSYRSAQLSYWFSALMISCAGIVQSWMSQPMKPRLKWALLTISPIILLSLSATLYEMIRR
jgi:hypothetical protein